MNWQAEFASHYHLSASRIQAFESLLSLLENVNDRNLTAVTGRNAIIDVHFRDSLSLLEFPELSRSQYVVDVGSGAGFPGLPLAIARPSVQFTMLESVSKKCQFIQSAISALGLANALVLNLRAEDAARGDLRESFDLALARAVGQLPVVLEYCLPLLRVGGSALLQRGSRESDDEAAASRAAEQLGGHLARIESVSPFSTARELHVWVLNKVAHTPDRFPRRPGMPRKRPL